ncbi:nucleoside triphosphate pyrophosphatase [Alphaproteobacteria bacterium LSUCC0684]
MPKATPKLVLASASPRRQELLAQIDIFPDRIEPADIDETPHANESPRTYVRRMAEEKGRSAAMRNPGDLVLAADTVVALGRRILGKPATRDEAERYLRLLSGRRHQVLTAVVLISPKDGKPACRTSASTVRFLRLGDDAITRYLETMEWQGKAGGYAIQGQAARFIDFISGSYSGIVGLPLAETARLLEGAGYRPTRPD